MLMLLLPGQGRASPPRPERQVLSPSAPSAQTMANVQTAQAIAGSGAGPATVPTVEGREFALFVVELDHVTLSESMIAYGAAQDPLVPVGELARLLDLDIEVHASEHAINGRIGESLRALTVDLDHSVARIGAVEIRLDSDSAAASLTDIYIKASVLALLLPIKISVDADDYRLLLTATELLPVQARSNRLRQSYNLGDAPTPLEALMTVATPYRWLWHPAFDISTETGGDNARNGLISRFEGRMAADVLKTDFTAFLSTNDKGQPASARLKFERRAFDADLFGPLHATYAAAGDVNTPSLVLGPRSYGGAGAVLSTAHIDDASVFQHINLIGELPTGYDVQLYINDVLRSGQTSPIQGRYEFIDVPLVRGLNVIRLVTFGPRGDRSEQTRVINVGGGQLATGKTVIDAGFVAQDAPVIEFPSGQLEGSGKAKGKLRFAANIAHGLSPKLTVTGGVGLFTDQAGNSHDTLTAGARGSLLGTSLQLDVAKDLKGGSAILVGAAGDMAGVSFIARHTEYAGAFVDENNNGFDLTHPIDRYSQLLINFSLPLLSYQRLPISGTFERSQFADGGVSFGARGRTTLFFANTLVAMGVDYSRRSGPNFSADTLTGNFSLSRLIGYNWQLRSSADYEVLPEAKLRTLSLTLDRALSERAGFRVGIASSFDATRSLSGLAGFFANFPFGEASLNGDYSTSPNRWRLGLQLRFGLAYDPIGGSYRMSRPGPANGASAALLAFTDNNGDGLMGAGDAPIAGIEVSGGGRTVTTDARGRALVTGLGDGQRAMVRTDSSAVDTLFSASPPQNISFAARAGDVVKLLYPFVPTSEVMLRLNYRRPDGSLVGLSAVRVRLIPDSGTPIAATTEFDGAAMFESVRPGHYRLALDAEQVRRLGFALAAPIDVVVDSKGRQIAVNGEIMFDKEVL